MRSFVVSKPVLKHRRARSPLQSHWLPHRRAGGLSRLKSGSPSLSDEEVNRLLAIENGGHEVRSGLPGALSV